MRISNGFSLPALLGAALIGSALLAQHDAQAWPKGQAPSGSFTQSCKVTEFDRNTMRLSAVCKKKAPGTRYWRDWYYGGCVGDIYNDDGMIGCMVDISAKPATTDAEYLAAEQAKIKEREERIAESLARESVPAFSSAAMVVLGTRPTEAERVKYLAMMPKPPFNFKLPHYGQEIQYTDAQAFFQKLIQQPDQGALRRDTATLAFLSAWGREPNALEFATADARMIAGKTWFVPMIAEEQKKMRDDPSLKARMIASVHMAAFGRPPTAEESAAWSKRPDDFSHAMIKLRKWLYSIDGVAERVATTKRALAKRGNARPTNAQVNQAMVVFGATSAVFDEMVASRQRI